VNVGGSFTPTFHFSSFTSTPTGSVGNVVLRVNPFRVSGTEM